MNRVERRYFLMAAGALAATPFASDARHPGKIARIGYLAIDLRGNPRGIEPFREGLRELGTKG